MPFDPSQPFDLLDAPAFDPAKPFEVVDDSFESQLKGGESVRPLLEAELEAETNAPAPTTKQQIGYGLRRGAQAVVEGSGNILQVPAIIGTRVVGGKQEEQPLYSLGEWMKQDVRKKMLAMYPEGDKTAELLRSSVLTEDVPAGIGSSLLFLAGGGLLGKALGSARGGLAATGALSQAGAQAEEARAFKASPNQEFVAALLGAGLGLTEAVGIGSVAARLDKASGGAFSKGVQSRLLTFGKNVSKETVEEMLQEGVQALGEDVIAKSLAGYDPERELGKELWDRVQAGGISGALISGLTSFGVRPRRVIQEPTTQLKPGDVIPGTERNDAITTRTAEEVLDEGATVARVPGDGQNRQNIAQVVAPRTADSAGDSAPGEVGAVVPPEVAPGPQVAPVVYRGYQEGFRNVPGYHLYNLTADLGPKLVKGSTVTEESLLKAGYTIPEAEKAKAVAPAPTVTQPTTKLERGVWSGGDVGQEPITALRLNDGTVLIDPEARIHATAFENLGVDPTTVADGGFVRGTEYKTSGADTARIVRQAVARKALAAKKPTTTSAPPADVAPQVPKSSLETINSAARVKLALPEGATFVRGTDARGKVAVQPVASFKNANPFRQAGIVTLEAGTNTRTGFVPMKGEVAVTDLAQAQIAQAPKAANPPKPTGLRRGQDWRYLDPNVVATSTKPAKPPRPATVKQGFDKLALDYVITHEIEHDPIVSEDVKTIHAGARSTHSGEKMRLRRVVFSALGIKGDIQLNADLEAALPKLKEAIAKREAKISVDETETDRAEFPKGTSTEFLPTETPAPKAELFPASETPFNLTKEAAPAEKPPESTTGFGEDTLAQQEMFAIQKIVESKDPGKSADAAVEMYGGPKEALAKIKAHLTFLDSDPDTKKAFKKDQRAMLKNVVALLEQRAGKPSDTANQIADSLEKLKAADPLQGNVSLFGLTQSVWNTAISIAQGIIRAGGKLADAVAAALAHIRANHKGDWDEAGATAALEASAQENADTDRDEQKFTSSPEFKANAELADELGIIRPDDDHSAATGEGVLTKVGNVHDVVLSRPGLNDAVRRNSVAAAKAALEEAGLNIVRAPDGLWKLANESTSQEAAGEKLVPILEREIQAARAEDRRERLANLLNSIAVHLGRDKNGAFSQSLKNRLYALAQGERSSFGRALGALAMWGKVLANVAQNPEIHLARIYSEAVTDADTETVIEKIKEAVAKPTPTEREASLKKIRAELTPKQRKKFKSKTLWDRVQRAARAGLFDENGILEELAREQGFTVPTEEQKAQMRDWVDEEERLRTPTARQIAKAGGDMDKATKETLAGTETERLALIKKIQAHWSRWALPTSWNPLKWRNLRVAQNNAKAVDEFVGANLLFKLGFATRQLIDVALVSAPLHAANRSLAHVLERAQNDGGLSADTLKDLQGAMKEMATARIASLKATVRSMERTLTGHTDRKTLDRMNHSIGVFERMNAKADALFASGNKAASYAVRFATILRAGYRVAEVLDAFQAVGLEWQEMRQQLSTDLRAQGKNRAEIATKLDDIFGGLKVDMLQAVEEVRAIKGERGLEPDEKNIEQDAWALLKARAYDRMRQATGLSTDYRGENETLAQLHAWNLPETGGIGGLLAETIKGIRSRTQKSGIPTGGLFSFGNAIGIAANRMATFSGLGLFGGWGFGDSPWYQGARNIRQRRIEAAQGLAAVGLLTALAAAGKILVQVKYPDDKDEKERFIAEGHKLNTIKFINDDGTWIEYPIQMSPFSFIAGPTYMIGGVQRLLSQRQREQDRLNADAARTGATPGKARVIGSGDIAGVIAQGMYGMLTGGRTASGAIQSFSDYGDFNLNKSASALLRPYIPAAPAWQEASRLMGVTMDTRTASLFELLVPTPSSPHQRVNSLGDPMVNPNDGLRVLQVLSGGIGFGREGALPETHAYRQIFASGYSTPDVGRTKGYNFGGVVRPMTPQELDRYAVARGQAFKRELEGVNVEGQQEAEARKTVQAAFQRANREALQSVGVSVPSRAESRASERPASGGGVSGGSFGGTVSSTRAGRLPAPRRLSRGRRLSRVRLGRGVRRGRLSRGLRRQPRLGRVRRRSLSRARLVA